MDQTGHSAGTSRRYAVCTLRPTAQAIAARPAVSALNVIERLSHAEPCPQADLATVRRRYRESRKPLLAPLEPVGSVVHIPAPSDRVPPLIVIRPQGTEKSKSLPALLYLHGGGWTVGEFETYEPLCRKLANATGQVVVWADYRLAPEHPFPAAFDDTVNAYLWIRRNAEHIGIDYRRIAIGGDSAGGNLAAAACLALRGRSAVPPPIYQLLLYPCLDLTASSLSHTQFSNGYLLTEELYRWYRQNYLGTANALHWQLSPLLGDLYEAPPAVVLYAGFDPLRDEAAEYAKHLDAARIAVRTLYYPDMIHGFLQMGGVIPTSDVAITHIAEAVRDLEDLRSPPSPVSILTRSN